jgi:hypothetical protein
MLPNPTIYVYEAMQGLVEERIERTKRRCEIHRLMQQSRVRKQFRRSVAQGLQHGLGEKDLAAELRSALQSKTRN